MTSLNQIKLKEFLRYNPETGIFTNLITRSAGAVRGTVAGSKNKTMYLQIQIFGKKYYSHRLAWLYVYSYMPENDIDHINRNKSDNRICNLREVSKSCNAQNTGTRKDNKTGVKGISWNKGKQMWIASIGLNKKKEIIGLYSTFKNAVIARFMAEKRLGWSVCDSSSSAYNYLKLNNILPKDGEDLSFIEDRPKKLFITNSSGVPGITKRKGSGNWMAAIGFDKMRYYLGTFENKIDAVRARSNAEIRLSLKGCKTTSIAYKYLKDRRSECQKQKQKT